jgi:hypothetical protein
MLRSALHLCALAVFGSAAAAQAPPPPAGTQPPPARGDATAAAGQTFRAKQVLGSKMSIQGNVAIGTVDDIVFNDAGSIEYLIVQNEGKLVTVPWQAAKFDYKAQTAVVSITEEKFRAIPTYTVQELPNFHTPAYRTEIYRLYNLTPRQERKLDRQDRRDDRRP